MMFIASKLAACELTNKVMPHRY